MKKKTVFFLGILLLGIIAVGCKKKQKTSYYEKMTTNPTLLLTGTIPGHPEKAVTKEPTPAVSVMKEPTKEVTGAPQKEPIKEVTGAPQKEPTKEVTGAPQKEPIKEVTGVPQKEPTKEVTGVSQKEPSKKVTGTPQKEPTKEVTDAPKKEPTVMATQEPGKMEITAADLAEIICKEMGYHTEEPFRLLENAGYWGKGLAETKDIYYKDLYLVLRKLGEELGLSTEQREKTAQSFGRISDTKGQSAETVEAAYYLYACGVCEGKSDGLFSGTRSFQFEQKASQEDIIRYIQRLLGKEKRLLLAPEGQLCREDNLPEFAEYYPYILADYPNAFYEWEFAWMKNEVAKERDETPHVAPKDMRTEGENTLSVLNREILEQQGEEYVKLAREYLSLLFNVNYKTTPTDEKWKRIITENAAMVRSRGGLNGNEYFQKQLMRYLEDMKENETVVECDLVATDPSMFYVSQGNWYLRCYVHYRICGANTVTVPGIRRNNVIFSESFSCNFQNVTLGKWRDGYFDLLLGVSSAGLQKPTIEEILVSDYLYETRVHP